MHKPSTTPLKSTQSRLNIIQPSSLKSLPISTKPKKINTSNTTTDRKRLIENNGKALFEFSKQEIESKIKTFIGFLLKCGSSAKENSEDYYKEATTVFMKMIDGFQKLIHEKDENRHRESPYPHKEIELIEKIQGLQGQKEVYEEKLRNHVTHTLHLEQKVTKLIEEYHNVIAVNEKLRVELNNSKQDTSIIDNLYDPSKSYSIITAEADDLRLKNTELENNLTQAEQKINRLESRIQKLHVFEDQNTKLDERIQKLNTQSFKMQDELDNLKKYMDSKTLIDPHASEEAFNGSKALKENHIIQKLDGYFLSGQQQGTPEERHISISFLETNEEVTIQSITHQIQAHFGEVELMKKRIKSQIEGYHSRIEALEKTLEAKDEEIRSAVEKFPSLHQTLMKEDETETGKRSFVEVLSALDRRMESLFEENMGLKVQNETSRMFITDLKNCVSLKNQQIEKLTKNSQQDLSADGLSTENTGGLNQKDVNAEVSLRNKKEELERDIRKYQFQIEEYDASIDKLSKKIQDLIKTNQGLTRDQDYVKKDFNNYRTIVQSLYMEARRHFEALKLQDLNVQSYFASPGNNFADNFNFLVNGYYMLRKEALNIDVLIEQRRDYI